MRRKAESYSTERDFAFFHVKFGTSKAEYLAMTDLEKAFIRKEYEDHVVFTNRQIRDAFYNAYVNANRKKNAKFQELYKKKQARADREYNENAIKVINEIEQKEGKSWVERIYRASGLKKPS